MRNSTVLFDLDGTLTKSEEGIINSKPFNMELGIHQLFGTIVFVGVDGEEFTNCPTTVWKYL